MSRSKAPRSCAMRSAAAAAPTRIENATIARITILDFCLVLAPTAATGKLTWPPPASGLEMVASDCVAGSTAEGAAPTGAKAGDCATELAGTEKVELASCDDDGEKAESDALSDGAAVNVPATAGGSNAT